MRTRSSAKSNPDLSITTRSVAVCEAEGDAALDVVAVDGPILKVGCPRLRAERQNEEKGIEVKSSHDVRDASRWEQASLGSHAPGFCS